MKITKQDLFDELDICIEQDGHDIYVGAEAARIIKEWIEPKWIPVSERLPDNYDRIAVTIQVNKRDPQVRSATYYDHHFAVDNGDYWNATDEEIKAWMPLPAPFK